MNKETKDVLSYIVSGVVVCGFVYFIVKTVVDTPHVIFDAITGDCIRVEPPSAGDCDNIPSKYRRSTL